MKNKDIFWLIGIILIVFIFNLFFLLKTEFFTGDSAYFNVRYVEHLLENKRPLTYDELSYGGRNVLVAPLFYYILAFFKLVLNSFFIYKLVPLLASLFLLVVVYLIAKEITDDKRIIFLSVLFTGFIPILTEGLLNQVSFYSFLLPVMFFMIYCLIKMKKNSIYLTVFIILSFILPLLHQDSLLLVFALGFYLLLVNLESMMYSKSKNEAILFFVFLAILIEFFIFKDAFLKYSLNLIWQNVPKSLLGSYFKDVSIFEIIYKVGVLPIFFGIVGLFLGIFKEKSESAFFLSSLILADFLFLWLNLITPVFGLMVLGIALTILSTLGLTAFFSYLRKTKFHKSEMNTNLFMFILIIFAGLFMVIPSIVVANQVIDSAPTKDEVEVLKFLGGTTFEFSLIGSSFNEGNVVSFFTNRQNIMDTNFLLAPYTNERLDDLNSLFTTNSEIKVKEISDKYSIEYLFFSDKARKEYNIDNLRYENGRCLKKVKEIGKIKAYKIKC